MGEIADMMLSGLLCTQCGVYIDYEEPGYPRLCGDCHTDNEMNKYADKLSED